MITDTVPMDVAGHAQARRAALAVGPAATVVLLCTEGSAANPVPSS